MGPGFLHTHYFLHFVDCYQALWVFAYLDSHVYQALWVFAYLDS